ncbi:hypothetical protein MNBD_GAMMA20-2301 [hydrothermal vent metagenome]|uniref:PilZ domain-containing protein n=1 Tax=hydrothermal vent metagenome TaxID=652676 RepID=A0A3B0ZX18_9ZZZZ
MEKRWSERKRLCVGVEVYLNGDLLNSGHSSDIGLGGTFLGIDSVVGINQDVNVELVFRLLSDGAGEEGVRHTVHARVVRIADQGVGFKFCDFDTGVFRSLQEIMAYQKHNSSGQRASCSR